jgi:hypothetical protein
MHIEIPIPIINYIEPQLEKFFGINHYMIMDDISFMYDYAISHDNMTEVGKKLQEECKESHHGMNIVNIDKFMMQTDAILTLDAGEKRNFNDLMELLERYKLDCNKYILDLFFPLCFVMIIINKFENLELYTSIEDDSLDKINYQLSIRPDMLKLYQIVKNTNKTGKAADMDISIKNGKNKPVHITNKDFWFINMLEEYLNKYLGVSSIEEAEHELETVYQIRRGKPKENPISYDICLKGTYDILQNTILKSTEGVAISTEQCKFIREYLCLLGIISTEEGEAKEGDTEDQNKIHARIDQLIKQDFKPNWYGILNKPYKLSPNNPYDLKFF